MIIRALLIVVLSMTSLQAAVKPQRNDTASFMQGSVDVVISTRDGFVLATDSRLTHTFESQITYSDDTQKLYPIGTHTACVVAGVQGATTGTDILRAATSVGTALTNLNKRALKSEVSAAAIQSEFVFALELIGQLIDPRYQSAGLTAELSFVSVNSDGTLNWNSGRIPFVRSRRESALTAGTPIYTQRLRAIPSFDVEVTGQGAVANSLLSATRSGRDRQSRSKMMRRYYRRKNAGQLDRFTLDEAVILARELVQATIDLAPRSAGVGGAVDIATLTQSGFRWIQQKREAPAVPFSHFVATDTTFDRIQQDLDGLQCVRCTFKDTYLFFTGSADVQLSNCKFSGACQLVITPEARRRKTEETEALGRLVGKYCAIVEPIY